MASIKSEKTVPIEPVLKSPESSDANPDRPELPAVRFWLLALSLCLGLLLSFMDSSIVATSLFAIGTEFQQMDTVNWVALAYTLCYLGFAVFFARLSDVIGRRNAFATAYLVFFAFSLGCGFAKTRIGGSGLYSITMIILLETTPAGTKQFLASMIGVVVAVGGVLGPVLGGVLTHYTSWRWVFWINGPIGFVSMVLFCLAWPKAEYLPNVERRTWKELDYPGSVLLIAAAVLVVFPFQDASSSALWDQAIFVVPLVVGLACTLEVEAKALGFLVFVGLGFGLSAAGTTMVGNLQSSLRDHSPAQGIIAQIRILGGSLGIAASSAILGTTLRSQLASVVDPKLLNSLENATSQLTSVQLNAVRRAYSEAFNEDMRVCAIVASVSVVLAFGAWTKPSSRPTVQERGAQHLKNEIDRRTAAANEY
ncbi:hypothetical protein TruAng_006525 [Truncatella angustata]|nr:hypothetical protein TruAng_006525 [Truncatella angustata]